MTKIKELEAFKKICRNLNGYEYTEEYKKYKKLIEETLKKYNENKIKALKLLKEKRIDIDLFLTILEDDNQKNKLKSYNFWLQRNEKLKITKKEYYLLKKILYEDEN